jgi:hypothetical protein
MPPITYASLVEIIESKGCQLVTTEEEFDKEKVHCKRWFQIVGKCGHASLIKYDMFKAQGCGVTCKDCAKKSMKDKLKAIVVDNQDIEYAGFCYVRSCLEKDFNVFKCVEGTMADFLVRPKGTEKDDWLPIQLKVTTKPNEINSGNYYFAVGAGYVDMCILCICLEDKRMWLFEPGDLRSDQVKVAIGKTRSKYTHCETTKKDVLKRKLMDVYNMTKFNQASDNLNMPRSKAQQREQEYRRLREQYLPQMSFQYPEREGLTHDFIVDGKRVQEKVATKRKQRKNSYMAHISRSKTLGDCLYKVGDADYYWIIIPDTTLFYLIPEAILLEKQIISQDVDVIKNNHRLYFNPLNKSSRTLTHGWLNEYIHDYRDLTQVVSIDSILGIC